MTFSPVVHRVVTALIRAELTAVNIHTLSVALERLKDQLPRLEAQPERQFAAALLSACGYPSTIQELKVFLDQASALTHAALVSEEILPEMAVHYMRWIPAFLEDMDANLSRNARLMLRWIATAFRETIAAQPESLDLLRRVADDPGTTIKSSAYIVYALGKCGTVDDYERVTRHAEWVIEHDREHLDMVADALYALYPPALINALSFFLERAGDSRNRNQFATGLALLSKVAEIEDRTFWRTYANEMSDILDRMYESGTRNTAVARLLDQVEKQLALAAYEED
ncbi:MAG: hypothetical protein OHK0023_08700 [Anaerolineae bacterium]